MWYHLILVRMHACVPAKSLQSCPTLCDPVDYSLTGSSVHGILQARTLEWAAMSSSRGSSWPGDRTCISYTTGGFLTVEPLGKPVTMAIIKESTNNKSWRKCGEKGALFHCWWECKLIHPLCRTVWRVIKKPGIKLPYDPIVSPQGICPEKPWFKRTHVPQCS